MANTDMLTCTIIDDEPLAARLLESYVRKTPFLSLAGVYGSASSSGSSSLFDSDGFLASLNPSTALNQGISFRSVEFC